MQLFWYFLSIFLSILLFFQDKDGEREQRIQKESSEKTQDINPVYVCTEIERVASKNAIIVADGGDFVGTASYILHPRGPLTWMDPGFS